MFTELKVSRIILDNWKIGRNVRVNNIFERFEIDDLNLESWDVSEVTNMY
ncbi:hypothetical protein IKO18_03070 [bacterium]|nr:hypothetical protein [bacterium]